MDLLGSFGIEIPSEMSGFIEGVGQTMDGLESIDLTKPMSLVTGTFKAVAGIGKAIGSLFNHDGSKEKRIQKMQVQIDALSASYNTLEKKIGDAFSKDASNLINQQNKLLEQQKVLIQNQIKEEQSKKNSDSNRIKEWQAQIDEINATIADNKKAAVDAIFGEDIKAAIENFADALTDAWNSGTDSAQNARDTVKKMMQNMVRESIKAAIQSSGEMEKIRQKLAEFFNDGILSEWEQNYVYNMAEQLQRQLDEQFGWSKNLFESGEEEREGASRGIATASQDSVDENNARLTTIQGHTYSLVQGLGELNNTSNQILARVTGIERNTGEANTKLDSMDKRMRDLHNTVEDINLKGIKLR